jgi:hypothetical protein
MYNIFPVRIDKALSGRVVLAGSSSQKAGSLALYISRLNLYLLIAHFTN